MSKTPMRQTQKSRPHLHIGGLLVTGLLVVSTQLAWGETPQPSRETRPGQERIAALDSDKDGMLNREEVGKLPRLAKHFDRIDANRDGQLNRDELRAAREHAQRFREKNYTTLRDMESESHQARIQILQQADACIKAASNPNAYRQCEKNEQGARLELRESMKSRREALMADARK